MKKLPLIIGIPAIAVALIVGGALVWKLQMDSAKIVSTDKQMPTGYTSSSKPNNPFSALFGTKAEPTPTPASAADLQQDLEVSTADDGGASDIKELQKDASGL